MSREDAPPMKHLATGTEIRLALDLLNRAEALGPLGRGVSGAAELRVEKKRLIERAVGYLDPYGELGLSVAERMDRAKVLGDLVQRSRDLKEMQKRLDADLLAAMALPKPDSPEAPGFWA